MANQRTSASATGSTSGGDGATTMTEDQGTKRPYVRLITDRRREQNRRAQKLYRERLRKRLETLEEQAATSTGTVSMLQTPPKLGSDDRGQIEEEPLSVTSSSSSSSRGRFSLVDLASTKTIPEAHHVSTHVFNLADAFLAAGDLPISQDSSIGGIRFDVAPTPPPEDPECEHVHEEYGDIDLRSIWPLPPQPRDKQSSTPGSKSKAVMNLSPRRTPGPHISADASLLADPSANHLRLAGMNSIEACIAIAIHLRIGRSAYINDHPSHFPSCYVAFNVESKSPKTKSYSFFSTNMAVTPQLAEHMDVVKDPLKPSPAQMMNPHPSYLDCIVFPYFRDLAVQASAQGILDHEQLFMDILYGGLVCWGGVADFSGAQRSRKRRRQMHDSVAWSPRSWEAKRWFLKKWGWLIGTEEEEEERGDVYGIWKGSRWWWNMRGEVDSEDESDDLGDDGEDLQIIDNLNTTGRVGEIENRYTLMTE